MVEDLFNRVGVELVVGNGVPYRLREGPPPDAQNYVSAVTPGQGSFQGRCRSESDFQGGRGC